MKITPKGYEYKECVPAYGRDYKSQKEVKADWFADKDFRVEPEGFYINRLSAIKFGIAVTIRYSKLQKVIVITPEQTK